jgi:hypothetical protein
MAERTELIAEEFVKQRAREPSVDVDLSICNIFVVRNFTEDQWESLRPHSAKGDPVTPFIHLFIYNIKGRS